MSRWLSSVNTLLEQLDGKVETAVEDQLYHEGEDDGQGVHNAVLEDILSKRGLAEETEQEGTDEVETPKAKEPDDGIDVGVAPDAVVTEVEPLMQQTETQQKEGTDLPLDTHRVDSESEVIEPVEESETILVAPTETTDEVSTENITDLEEEIKKSAVEKGSANDSALNTEEPATSPKVVQAEPAAPPPPATPSVAFRGKDTDALVTELREAQKEARTLRRHVVSINTQLEEAESEINAQRTELERAAERMERDRARHKEEKEKLLARQGEEIKSVRQQHEIALADHKKRTDEQLEKARKRLRALEERRMQEGGDWTKELEDAVQREQASTQRQIALEDEKSTLLSQVSTLQSQQTALESRLESVTQMADTAMDREREASDQLDSVMSLHARQLSQRQAREVELERTVAELGAALVVARNREISRLQSTQTSGELTGGSEEQKSLRAKLEESEDELETVKAQLELERRRCQTLHQELRDVSQERTEEASAAHARQLHHDRELADMSLAISRLQSKLRDSTKKEASLDRGDMGSKGGVAEEGDKMKLLTEQVLKQQEKIGSCTSEISALRSRLRAALSRAESAEALAASGNSTDRLDALERGSALDDISDGSLRRTMRRRVSNGGGRTESYGGSIRSAIRLAPGQTDRKEKIGRAIDTLDQWSVETGKFLRFNPLARGAFLLYLLVLHIWTFILLMFHADNYERVHGDFSAGVQAPHGPHALMHN